MTHTPAEGITYGQSFDDQSEILSQSNYCNMKVTQIHIIYGSLGKIRNLKVEISDGTTSFWTTSATTNTGVNEKYYSPPAGEEITRIDIWYNSSNLTGFRFETDQGTQSEIIGSSSDSSKTVYLNGILMGFHGMASNLVHSVGPITRQ